MHTLAATHLMTARTYAGGVSAALSEADAFRTHDPRRTDHCLVEALAACDAARAAILKTMDQRRATPARPAAGAIGRAMATAASALFVLAPLAALVFGRF